LPDLTTEYNDNTEQLQHDRSTNQPTRSEPTPQHETGHSSERPNNQDLLDAIGNNHSADPNEPDIGLSI
jgi:hypothetical protein